MSHQEHVSPDWCALSGNLDLHSDASKFLSSENSCPLLSSTNKTKRHAQGSTVCSLLWSKWQMSMHFYTSMQIRMLMSWKRTMSIFSHNHSISFFLFLCFTLTYTHTNNAGTAWNKQSMLGFFVHRIHDRMLEKTFIKGFNTSRVFSWRISFWTNTYTGDIYKCLWLES